MKKKLLTLSITLAVFVFGCEKDKYEETVGVCPLVVSTVAIDEAVDVPLDQVITVTFNEKMNPETITEASFTLQEGITPITGTVSYSALTASFVPSIPLSPFMLYKGTMKTLAKDLMGNALQTDYIWTFTTIPQTGLSSLPVVGGTTTGAGTFAQGSPVTVTATPNEGYSFSSWTEGETAVSTNPAYQFTMTGNRTLVANFTLLFVLNLSSNPETGGTTTGSGSYNAGTEVSITATANTEYTFVNWTEDETIVFPASGNTFAVDASRTLVANFAIRTYTLNVTGVDGTVVKNPEQATYDSGEMVQLTATPSPGYTFISWSGDATGSTNPLPVTMTADKNITANFTVIPPVTPVVDMKTADRFGILSGVGISNNAGFSVIHNMDVGISPGVRSSVTGFPPATVVGGAIYTADDGAATAAMLTQAKLDLTAAYLFAEGATSPAPAIVSGDQGGLTLAPGIYKSTSTLLIQSGNLTLDAKGDPNAVWIFQIASNFTTVGGAGGSVVLTGGANADNIFWQTGSSAVIGDYTTFYGNILALQSITMNSHAVATGRMLAQNGAIVLTDTNTINKP